MDIEKLRQLISRYFDFYREEVFGGGYGLTLDSSFYDSDPLCGGAVTIRGGYINRNTYSIGYIYRPICDSVNDYIDDKNKIELHLDDYPNPVAKIIDCIVDIMKSSEYSDMQLQESMIYIEDDSINPNYLSVITSHGNIFNTNYCNLGLSNDYCDDVFNMYLKLVIQDFVTPDGNMTEYYQKLSNDN